MDYDIMISQAMFDAEEALKTSNDALSKVRALKSSYKESVKFTNAFLKKCSKNGIKRVAIGKEDETLERCKTWPFGFSSSIFTNKARVNDNVALWETLNECGIPYSCGNGDQAQVGETNLVDGVYAVKNGVWEKLR